MIAAYKRWIRARRSGALVAATAAFAVSLVVSAPNAVRADAIPIVPVAGPVGAAGTPVATGTAVTGSQVVGVVAAGLGAYDATCKTLEFLTGGWSDCGTSATEYVATKFGFGFLFGSNGDDRSPPPTISGTALTEYGTIGILRGSIGTSGYQANTPYTLQIGTGGQTYPDNGGHRTRVIFDWGPLSANCNATLNVWSHAGLTMVVNNGPTADMAAVNAAAHAAMDSSPVGHQTTDMTASPGCFGLGSPLLTRIRIGPHASCTICTPFPRATWVPDQGLGTPWELEYTLECEKAGVVVEAVRTIQFTPTPGMVSPPPELPTCESVLPGSHIKGVSVTGGRDTVEGPSNDVQVHYPAYDEDFALDYPLCTTHAPAGGCFLDLQRDGKSCFGPNVYCAGWPQNITRWKMSCEWGPYLLEITACQERYQTVFDVVAPPNPKPTTAPPNNPPEVCQVNCNTPPIPPVPPIDPHDPDKGGENCISDTFSMNPINWVYIPIKCLLIWAFVPDPDSWGWDGFIDQVKTRPPTSVVIDLVSAMGDVADGFSGAGTCGSLANFGNGMNITCPGIRDVAGYTALYAIVQAGLVGLTAFTVFHILRESVGGSSS